MKIWLTNATSRNPPFRGPGRVLTIMARPRAEYGETGEGSVPELVPDRDLFDSYHFGSISLRTYQASYLDQLTLLRRKDLSLQEGDTLICACSREKARKGLCHRVWAAQTLNRMGFEIVLDGLPYPEPQTESTFEALFGT